MWGACTPRRSRTTLSELSDATHQAIALSGTSGVLNLATLPTFGTRWLIPRIPDFFARHPGRDGEFRRAPRALRLRRRALRCRHPFRRAALARRGVRIAAYGGGGACLQPGLPAAGEPARAAGPDARHPAPAEHPTDGLGGMVRRRRSEGGQSAARPALRAIRHGRAGGSGGPGRRSHPAFPDRGRAGLRPPGDPLSQKPRQRRRLLSRLSRAQGGDAAPALLPRLDPRTRSVRDNPASAS